MKKRIVLVHWNAAEAEVRAEELRAAGFDVTCHSDERANPRILADGLPGAFVIDLRRVPSHGRELGAWLRRNVRTRDVPLVFVEGTPEKTERVRRLLPDAAFTPWADVPEAIERAMSSPLEARVIPGTMDAYLGVALSQKLGIQPGARTLLQGAPPGFEDSLSPLPEGATVSHIGAEADIILLFAVTRAGLDAGFAEPEMFLAPGGRLWILWPKRSSGVKSDLTQTTVRAFGLARGFVDYKIAAIDATWSGLCFARRTGSTSPGAQRRLEPCEG